MNSYGNNNSTSYSNGVRDDLVYAVDDNIGVTGIIAELGEACGKEVRVYSSGEEALEAFYRGQHQGQVPGLLISDQNMGGIDGLTLCEQVRKRFPETFRVILTGDMFDQEVYHRAVEDGTIHAYILKPCPPGSLTELLEGFRPASPMEVVVPFDKYINR